MPSPPERSVALCVTPMLEMRSRSAATPEDAGTTSPCAGPPSAISPARSPAPVSS